MGGLPVGPDLGGRRGALPLAGYLPTALAEFSDLLATHPLRREIAVTVTANEVFNRMVSGVLLRVMQLTGRREYELIPGFLASRDVLGLPELWREIDTLDLSRHADLQTRLLVEIRTVAERTTRWFLRNRSRMDPADEVTRLRPGMEKLAGALLQVLPEQSRVDQQRRIDQLVEQGAPVELAHDICALRPLSTALDLVEAAHDLDADLPWLAEVYFDLAERLDLAWLRAQASYHSADSHWLVLAKTSMRDELSTQQRRLTVAILNDMGTDTPPRSDRRLAGAQPAPPGPLPGHAPSAPGGSRGGPGHALRGGGRTAHAPVCLARSRTTRQRRVTSPPPPIRSLVPCRSACPGPCQYTNCGERLGRGGRDGNGRHDC